MISNETHLVPSADPPDSQSRHGDPTGRDQGVDSPVGRPGPPSTWRSSKVRRYREQGDRTGPDSKDAKEDERKDRCNVSVRLFRIS